MPRRPTYPSGLPTKEELRHEVGGADECRSECGITFRGGANQCSRRSTFSGYGNCTTCRKAEGDHFGRNKYCFGDARCCNCSGYDRSYFAKNACGPCQRRREQWLAMPPSGVCHREGCRMTLGSGPHQCAIGWNWDDNNHNPLRDQYCCNCYLDGEDQRGRFLEKA